MQTYIVQEIRKTLNLQTNVASWTLIILPISGNKVTGRPSALTLTSAPTVDTGAMLTLTAVAPSSTPTPSAPASPAA